MPELIADSIDAYIDLAIKYGHEQNALASLKQELKTKIATTPLFNTAYYTQHLESAYKMAWEQVNSKVDQPYLKVPKIRMQDPIEVSYHD